MMSKNLKPDPATATGAGTLESVIGSQAITIAVKITGGPSAVTVDIEGSIGVKGDGDSGVLATHIMTAAELTAGFAMFHIAGKPADWINYNVITLTGGTAPTVAIRVKSVE